MGDVDERARALLEDAGLVPGPDDERRAVDSVDRVHERLHGPERERLLSIFGYAMPKMSAGVLQLVTANYIDRIRAADASGDDEAAAAISTGIRESFAITLLSMLEMLDVDVTLRPEEGGSR